MSILVSLPARPARSRRLVATTALGFGVLAAGVGLAPGAAFAGCVLAANVVCSGPVADTLQSIAADSVSYITGETNSSTKGLLVNNGGIAVKDVNVFIDATSSISATDATGAAAGNALFLFNNKANITTTTPSGAGILGNLTSTVAAGLKAQNTLATGNITIVQGSVSTITGTTAGIDLNATGGTTDVTIGGVVKATAGTGVAGVSTTGDITVTVLATGKIDPLIGVDLATVSGTLTVNNAGVIQGDNIGVQLKSTGAVAGLGALVVAQTGTGNITGTAAQGVTLTSVDANQVVTGNGNSSTITGGTIGVEMIATGKGTIALTDNKITGGTGGLLAKTTGTGAIVIAGTGDITATTGTAVELSINNSANTQSLVFSRTGDVKGDVGIVATTNGKNNIFLLPIGNVTGTTGVGIQATNTDAAANANNITIVTSATKLVSGATDGIVTNLGISTGTATVSIKGEVKAGAAGAGVKQTSIDGTNTVIVTATGKIDPLIGVDQITVNGANLVANAGAITGTDIGVRQTATGTGTDTVDNTGTITGTALQGVTQSNVDGDATVKGSGTINGGTSAVRMLVSGAGNIIVSGSNTLNGGNYGIFANQGVAATGGINITTTGGDITGTNFVGISALIDNAANSNDITVDAGGDVLGKLVGIGAISKGTGNVSVVARGDVTATAGQGIFAQQTGATVGAVSVTTTAGTTITANDLGNHAIIAQKMGGGTGLVSVDSNATVDAAAGFGIFALNLGSDGVKVSNAGDINAFADGIFAVSKGSAGNVTVINSGDISTVGSGTPTDGSIFAAVGTAASAGNVKVELADGSISGVTDGVAAGTIGLGSVTVTGAGLGTVTSTSNMGVHAEIRNAANAQKILIDTQSANITGRNFGILAKTIGTGDITVTPGGDVTATAGTGILAMTSPGTASAANITVGIKAGKTVTATADGIVTDLGKSTGLAKVTIDGVSKGSKNGVNQTSTVGSNSTTVNGEVTATNTGVFQTSTDGNNTVIVTATGKIDPLIGIDQATVNGANLVTNAGSIIGTDIGVRQGATGTGTDTVDNSGSITGTALQGVVQTVKNGDALVKGAGGTIKGGTFGVEMTSSGTGNLTVNGSNTITGGSQGGLRAIEDATGTGSISIVTTGGDITTTGGVAINAQILNAANSKTVTVDVAGTVAGATAGVLALSQGTGDVVVKTAKDVSASNGTAVSADQLGATTGAVSVTTTGGTLTSSNGSGIFAQKTGTGTGLVSVINAAALGVAGGDGIAASTAGTDGITVANTGAITHNAAGAGNLVNGISVLSTGSAGDVKVTNAAAIGTGADSVKGSGISAVINNGASAGNVTVTQTSGDIFATKGGIDAGTTGSGAVTVTGAGTGVILATAGVGVRAQITNAANSKAITVDLAAANINGTSGIVATTTGTGDVTVTPGGDVTATAGTGILAQNTSGGAGNVTVTVKAGKTVTATDVQATGFGVRAVSTGAANTGPVTVTGAGNVTGLNGILASAATGPVTVSGAGTTTANGGFGIKAEITGAASTSDIKIDRSGLITGGVIANNAGTGATLISGLNIDNSVVVAGAQGAATGIDTSAGKGTTLVTLNGNVVASGKQAGVCGDGIAITSGSVSVQGTSAHGCLNGINVTSTTGALDLGGTTPDGSFVGDTKNGILANAKTTATIATTGPVTGNALGTGAGDGMNVTAGGDISIDSKAGAVKGDNGIVALSTGGGVKIAGSGAVTGTKARGIDATGKSNVDILGTGTVTGGSDGISAVSTGAGAVNVTGTGAVLGKGGAGIIATSGGGDITVAPASTVDGKAGDGITTKTIAAGKSTVTTAGAVTGSVNGINATTVDGANAITNVGGVTGGTNGILAAGTTGDIKVLGVGDTTGTAARGIDATTGGAVSITASGKVTGGTDGIAAVSTGAKAVSVTGTDAVVANGGTGILATSQGGNVKVAPASTVTATGVGVSATTILAGSVDVTAVALVTAGGDGIRTSAATGTTTITTAAVTGSAGSSAINASATTGKLTVIANGALTAGTGIKAKTDGIFDITSGSTITATTGIDLSGAATGTGTITNNGLIDGSATGVAMASKGTLALINNGTIGKPNAPLAINTTAGVLNVANPGTINGVITTAGGGITNLNNSGTWNQFGNSTLTTLANSGTINMVNGVVTYNVTVSGAYSASGASLLKVDISLSTNNALQRADQLNAGTLNPANTGVFLNVVGPKTFFVTPVVVAQGAVGGGTFSLANPASLASVGIVDYTFSQFAPGKWGVSSTVNTKVVGGISGTIAGAISSINTGFFLNSDPIISTPPNPNANQWCGGPWIRTAAGRFDLKGTASTAPAFGGTNPVETSTKYAAYQVGADAGVCNINGGGVNAHAGVMGGQVFADGKDTLNGDSTIKFNIPYFGLYGAVTAGGFSGLVMARREAYDMDVSSKVANLNQATLHGQGWAFSSTLRYRFDLPDAWLIEPSAEFSYEKLTVGSLVISPGVLGFSPFTSALGRLGVRVGKSIQYDGYGLQPYVQANVWHEFAGNLKQNFFVAGLGGNPDSNVPIALSRIGTFYQAGAGLAFQTSGGWIGFGQADVRFGSKVRAYSATLAIRRQF